MTLWFSVLNDLLELLIDRSSATKLDNQPAVLYGWYLNYILSQNLVIKKTIFLGSRKFHEIPVT